MSAPFPPPPQPGELVTRTDPTPTRKVVASTGGAGAGGGAGMAVAILLLGYLQRQGWSLNPDEAGAVSVLIQLSIAVVFPMIGALVSGWLVRERAP